MTALPAPDTRHPAPRRLRLTLGYCGTRYAGWAIQSPSRTRGRPTIQGTVESVLAEALGHAVRVTAAGRTDAGVHAEGQVVSFETTSTITPSGLRSVLSTALPEDVWVTEAREATAGFDARRSANRRWYRYALWRGHASVAAWYARSLVHPRALDVTAMRRAAEALIGTQDFTAFASHGDGSTVRTVFAADWRQISANLLLFEICADAFLKHMVRGIVGSLLWVGVGRWTPSQFATALESRDRQAGGPNAPAHGLTLHRIDY